MLRFKQPDLEVVEANVIIDKFIDQTFHVVESERAHAPWEFIDVSLRGVPPGWEPTGLDFD